MAHEIVVDPTAYAPAANVGAPFPWLAAFRTLRLSVAALSNSGSHHRPIGLLTWMCSASAALATGAECRFTLS